MVPSRAEMLARMDAADDQDDKEIQRQGRDDGLAWVRTAATRKQLARLKARVEASDGNGTGTEDDFVGYVPARATDTLRSRLADAILGPGAGDGEDGFWESLFGEDFAALLGDKEYVAAFVTGALTEWQEAEEERAAKAKASRRAG